MPASVQGKWFMRRDVNDSVITVKAVPIPRMGTWGITCTLNGEVIDFRHGDDVFAVALAMISAAIMETEVPEIAANVVELAQYMA